MKPIYLAPMAAVFLVLAACDRPADEEPMMDPPPPPAEQPPPAAEAPPPPDEPPPPAIGEAPPPADPAPDVLVDIASFEELDEGNDGFITFEEAQAEPALAENFEQYDRNNDGVIDEAEFSQFRADAEAGVLPGADPGMDQPPPGGPPQQ